MGALVRHCLQRTWALTAQGGGQAPAFADNAYVNFNCNDIPSLTMGRLANYMPAICLTAYGTITTGNTTGGRMSWEDLAVALYQDFDMPGAWQGRPVNNQAFRGATARIWELIAMGYQPGARRPRWINSCATARKFRHTLYIPLAFLLGDDPVYSAQLAVLYRTAQLKIHTAGVGTVMPNGDTVATLSANIKASAVLIPQARVALAPAQEWIEYLQPGAAAGSASVQLQSFGDVTSLDGVQPGAGVDALLALTSVGQIGGSFNGSQLTQFSASFIEQTETQHLDPFMQMLEETSGFGQRAHDQYVYDAGVTTLTALLGEVSDFDGFPYAPGGTANDSAGGNSLTNAGLSAQALCLPIIVPGAREQVTKIPVFQNTVQYNRYVSALDGTVDRTLSHQLKSWTPAKVGAWLDFVAKEGIFQAVYGTNDVVPIAATNDQAPTVDISTARFLPIEYVPRPAKA